MRYVPIILVCLLPTIAPAQDEETDRGLIASFLQDNLSGAGRQISIYGFSGALSSKAEIERLTIADDQGIWLTAEGLVLDWDRSALLTGRIEIADLTADAITVDRAPKAETEQADVSATASDTPFALPDLPVSVNVDRLLIDTLNLGAPILGEAISLNVEGNAALADGEGSAALTASRVDGAVGVMIFEGGFSNETRNLALNLTLSEGEAGIAARLLDLPDLPSVDLSITGDAPITDFAANIALDTNGERRLTGDVTLITTTDETAASTRSFDVDLNGDVTALFLPEYRDFFGPEVSLRAAGQTDDGGFDLSTLALNTQSMQLVGSAEIGASGLPDRFALVGQLGRDDDLPLLLPISGDKTYLSSASINIGFDAEKGDEWTADIIASDFERAGITIPEITLTGGGTIVQTGQITADMDYAANGISFDDGAMSQAVGSTAAGELILNYEPDGPLTIDRLTLVGAGVDADISAVATFGENPVITTDSQIAVSGLSRFASLVEMPDLSGDASVAVTGEILPLTSAADFAFSGQTNDLTIGIEQLDNMLTGQGNIDARFIRDTQSTRIENLIIATPDTDLAANAELTPDRVTGDATFSTAAGNLVPGATGTISAIANGARTTEGAITATADVTLNNDTITAQLDLPATGTGPFAITADVSDLSQFAQMTGLNLNGAADVTAQGTASSDFNALSAQITANTRNASIGTDAVDTLLSGSGSVSAQVDRDGSQIDLTNLNVAFPNITATGRLSTNGETGSANYNARLADIGLFTPDFSGAATASGTARMVSANRWVIDTALTGPGGTNADVAGQINGSDLALTARGSLPLALLNGALEPRRLAGTAGFNLSINGPAELSSLAGTITIGEGELSAPTLGQSLTNVAGTANLSGETVRLDLTGRSSNGGRLEARGTIGTTGAYPAALTVDLRNLVLRDPTLYETKATGTIAVNGPLAGGAAITGQINLDETEVQVPSSTVGSLGDLPDVTHVGASTAVRQTLDRAGLTETGQEASTQGAGSTAYPLNIVINAPSQIFVRGRGLDAELGGQLTLTGTTDQVIPAGQFSLIRGRLDILQQRFNLTEGNVRMQGDFVPVLRFVATTQTATDTTVSVVIEGPASAPEVSFESSPELPQDEVLSQLIFGRDLSSISAFQALQLANAVNTLAGRGGDGIVGAIRKGAGLDDLDVTTDADGNAAVSAGKYISDNVYTDVTVNAAGETEVNLNLDITSDITAKGGFGSDGETSIGIFFERDY